ncbi:hypothetical protein [Halorhabdus salina]|uniref:hypothetical protein n=1 Tax=Halorhabdus salina TaxID=2750670 RepID=UPI0015EEAF94|nr:hypothetical protein [Halorhabdus salina]
MVHPSRAVSVAYLSVGFHMTAWGIVTVGESTLRGGMVLVGGVVLLVSGLYGLVNDESTPIVTEYGLHA